MVRTLRFSFGSKRKCKRERAVAVRTKRLHVRIEKRRRHPLAERGDRCLGRDATDVRGVEPHPGLLASQTDSNRARASQLIPS